MRDTRGDVVPEQLIGQGDDVVEASDGGVSAVKSLCARSDVRDEVPLWLQFLHSRNQRANHALQGCDPGTGVRQAGLQGLTTTGHHRTPITWAGFPSVT